MATELFERMMNVPPQLTNGTSLQTFLRRHYNLSQHRSEAILCEYLRFLALAATRAGKVAPSHLIDIVWRHHVDDTQAYQDYCVGMAGNFMHRGQNPEQEGMNQTYAATLEAIEREFGEKAHPKIWPNLIVLKVMSYVFAIFLIGFFLAFLGAVGQIFLPTHWFVNVGLLLIVLSIVLQIAFQPWSLHNHVD